MADRWSDDELRLTARELDQIDTALNAEATPVPELVAAIKAARADARVRGFVVRDVDCGDRHDPGRHRG